MQILFIIIFLAVSILLFLKKNIRSRFFQSIYIISEILSIFFVVVIISISFKDIFGAVIIYINEHSNSNSHKILIDKLFASFELLFIAPIPLLIFSALKKLITKVYPSMIKESNVSPSQMLDEIDAKKTFVGSLIGVISTLLLGNIIKLFQFDESMKMFVVTDKLLIDNAIWLVFLLSFLLLMLLIFYYRVLSNHHKENK